MVFLPVLVFIFGTIIGSFLNVVIFRLNTGRSAARGRSKCVVCNRTLHWIELVPVWSFLALGGKCKTCRTQISFQYPVVELSVAILFVLFYNHLLSAGLSPFAIAREILAVVLVSLGVVIAVYDLKHKIIPTTPMRLALLLAFLSVVASWLLGASTQTLVGALLAGPLVALPFFLLWFISRGRWMGFGDVYLALAIGLLFGLVGGATVVVGAFWLGGLVGLFLLALSHNMGLKSEVPFAPFLIISAIVVYLTGASMAQFFVW